MHKPFTDKQVQVLAVLRRNPTGLGPTDIGLKCGRDWNSASSWASPAIKALVKGGYLIRFKDRTIKYKLTPAGVSVAKELAS